MSSSLVPAAATATTLNCFLVVMLTAKKLAFSKFSQQCVPRLIQSTPVYPKATISINYVIKLKIFYLITTCTLITQKLNKLFSAISAAILHVLSHVGDRHS